PRQIKTIRGIWPSNRPANRLGQSGRHVLIGVDGQNPPAASERGDVLSLPGHGGVPALVQTQVLSGLQILPGSVRGAVIQHHHLVAEGDRVQGATDRPDPVVDDHHRTELAVVHGYPNRESAFWPRIFASASAGNFSARSRFSSRSHAYGRFGK